MYWTGALGGAVMLCCGMGLAVGQFATASEPKCSLQVLSDGAEVITCSDGSVSRVNADGANNMDAMDFSGGSRRGRFARFRPARCPIRRSRFDQR